MAKSKTKWVRRRVQFDFAISELEKIDGLVKKYSLASRAELVRNAIAIYNFLAEQEGEEISILLRDGRLIIVK